MQVSKATAKLAKIQVPKAQIIHLLLGIDDRPAQLQGRILVKVDRVKKSNFGVRFERDLQGLKGDFSKFEGENNFQSTLSKHFE